MAVQQHDRTGAAWSDRRRECGEENYPAALLAVAAHGLPGASRLLPSEPLGQDAWAELLVAARAHRMFGFLRQAIDAGVLPVSASQAQQARHAHRSGMLRVLMLEGQLLDVVDRLTAAGVEVRVLKGTAVAHLDYPTPGLRPFIDLDVAVRPEAIGRSVGTLVDAGLVRFLAEPRPGFDRRFDKGVTLRHPAGYEVDLHRTFVLGPWGLRVDLDDLWDAGQEFSVGGRTLRALSAHNRFLHACYHAALGDWPLRLISLRDVAEMASALEPDAARLRDRAARWGIEAVVAAAVADAWRLLGLTTGSDLVRWARHYPFSRREVADLALYTHADKTFAAQAVSSLRAIRGLRDKAAYVRALTLPDRAYTAGRHSSALARLRYAIREVRRGREAQR